MQVTSARRSSDEGAAQCSKLGYNRHPWNSVRSWWLAGQFVVVADDRRRAHGDEDHSGPLIPSCISPRPGLLSTRRWCRPTRSRLEMRWNTAVIGGGPRCRSATSRPRCHPGSHSATLWDCEILGNAEAIRASGLVRGIVDAGLSRGLACLRQHAGGQPRGLSAMRCDGMATLIR